MSYEKFHVRINTLPKTGAILVRWIAPNCTPSDSLELKKKYKNLEEIGQTLYQLLFSDNKSCAEKKFQSARGKKICLIIEIDTASNRREMLLSLPWELLHDGQSWLALDPDISIVRSVFWGEESEAQIDKIPPPMRVLFAYAEPQDANPVYFDKGGFDIAEESLTQMTGRLLCPTQLDHVKKPEFEQAVKEGVHIIHFLGHGALEGKPSKGNANETDWIGGKLYVESDGESSDVIYATEFASWIKSTDITPKLVLFLSCHSGNPTGFGFSGVATALFRAGVEAVIAMQTTLSPKHANSFVEAFYRNVEQTSSIASAVQAGRRALSNFQRSVDPATHKSVWIEDKTDNDSQPKQKESSKLQQGGTQSILGVSSNEDSVDTKYLHRVNVGDYAIDIPTWSVPTLFLRGEGRLQLELPESPYTWPGDDKKMVYIEEGRFYMDKYPVTRREYRNFANKTGRPIPNWPQVNQEELKAHLRKYLQEVPNSILHNWDENLPATCITVIDALAYAEWAGKHLPTPEEWQQAALSGCPDKSWYYPWGNNLGERICNTQETGSNQLWHVCLFNEPCNLAGVCDVVGNVAEWAKDADGKVYICGGSFKDWGENCRIQNNQLIVNPNHRHITIGFRCAATLREWMNKKESTNGQ